MYMFSALILPGQNIIIAHVNAVRPMACVHLVTRPSRPFHVTHLLHTDPPDAKSRVRHTPSLLGASGVRLPRRVERETECLDVSFHEKGVDCNLRYGDLDGDHGDKL